MCTKEKTNGSVWTIWIVFIILLFIFLFLPLLSHSCDSVSKCISFSDFSLKWSKICCYAHEHVMYSTIKNTKMYSIPNFNNNNNQIDNIYRKNMVNCSFKNWREKYFLFILNFESINFSMTSFSNFFFFSNKYFNWFQLRRS